MAEARRIIKRIPVVGSIASSLYRRWLNRSSRFSGSREYWRARYTSGGNSGDGSYGQLALFKAEVINAFVQAESVETVIEYGCGDGNQLGLAEYPSYIGFDISPEALGRCRAKFAEDASKTFKLLDAYDGETADLTLSLDVIFHLIEEQAFAEHMSMLFNTSTRFVIIYSSNTDVNDPGLARHFKNRNFSTWVDESVPAWRLKLHVPNRYPFKGDTTTGSYSDFYIYEKVRQ